MTRRSGQTLPWRTLSAITTAGARCVYCGSREDLVAHHRLPRRLGGPDVLENLEPVCRSCHPGIEQEARAEGELVWERPERPDRRARHGRRPRLIPPY